PHAAPFRPVTPHAGLSTLSLHDALPIFRQVPSQHLDFARDSAKADYVDIVQVATLQSYLGSEHPYAQLDWNQVPAFTKLGLDPRSEEHTSELQSREKLVCPLLLVKKKCE